MIENIYKKPRFSKTVIL